MAFKIPKSTGKANSPTGLPNQSFYDGKQLCPKCDTEVNGDYCKKCGRKVTCDPVEPRREKDLTDRCAKIRYEFSGITPNQAMEIMTNGDCSTNR